MLDQGLGHSKPMSATRIGPPGPEAVIGKWPEPKDAAQADNSMSVNGGHRVYKRLRLLKIAFVFLLGFRRRRVQDQPPKGEPAQEEYDK